MIRELVLQLKLGRVRRSYFRSKYHVDILERFRDQFASLDAEGYLAAPRRARSSAAPGGSDDLVELTRDGLLRVDVLLPRFFLPQHAGIRYT